MSNDASKHTRAQVRTEAETVEAIATAKALTDHFTFIEVGGGAVW